MSPGQPPDLGATVVVPVYGRLELTLRCLASIDRWTDPGVPLLIIDDCGPDRLLEDQVRAVVRSRRPWTLLAHTVNQGFVRTANEGFRVTAPHDVAMLNSDVVVLPGWLEQLQAAACRPTVASASSLTNEGTILTVRGLEALEGGSPEELARIVSVSALDGAPPEIPVAVAHCTYYRRAALDRVGLFDEVFSPGYGEEVDWSVRARRHGLRHVAAPGSLVLHVGGASFGTGLARRALLYRHELRLAARYPREFVAIRWFGRRKGTPLARAIGRVSTAVSAEVLR